MDSKNESEGEDYVALDDGDFAIVFKSDGDVKIIVMESDGDEEKDQKRIQKAQGLAEFLSFALDSDECLNLFRNQMPAGDGTLN